MFTPFAAGRLERLVVPVVVAYAALLAAITVFAHPTPLYLVETDLVGEYIPAARAIAGGTLDVAHMSFKGPGYPLLLAATGRACGGDYYLGARLLSALAAGAAAWLAWLLVRGFAGGAVAAVTLLFLMFNPTFARYAIEAGTDLPAMAIALAATVLVLRSSRPATLATAGLLAGFATITRYNAVFLLPAAAVVLLARRGARRGLAFYAAGALVPLGGWFALNAQLTGHALANRNYLNIAWELYGRDLPWDRFETTIGSRFRSLGDVIAYDPLHAAARIGWNVLAQRFADARDLITLPLGLAALPGIVHGCLRRGWRGATLHFALAALVLAPVFYSARFSLYLLPFYLAGAALLVVEAPRALHWARARLSRGRALAGSIAAGPVVAAFAATLTLPSGVVAVRTLHTDLAGAPHEVRLAGERLARAGLGGACIMARKPHVAYFAGMRYAPMPPVTSPAELMAKARAEGARYIFYSPIEQVMRPECAVLADSGVALPGLDPVAWGSWPDHGRDRAQAPHFYAVYRVSETPPDSAAFAEALHAALLRCAERHADVPETQLYVALQLLELRRPREALDRLLPLARGGLVDAAVARALSSAFLGVDDLENAWRACEEAVRIGPETARDHVRMGAIRARQGRWTEARDQYARAVALEPASIEPLEKLALVEMKLGDYAAAASHFDRCVTLAPRDIRLRRYALGAYAYAGNQRRAKELLDDGLRRGLPLQLMLDPASGGASK